MLVIDSIYIDDLNCGVIETHQINEPADFDKDLRIKSPVELKREFVANQLAINPLLTNLIRRIE